MLSEAVCIIWHNLYIGITRTITRAYLLHLQCLLDSLVQLQEGSYFGWDMEEKGWHPTGLRHLRRSQRRGWCWAGMSMVSNYALEIHQIFGLCMNIISNVDYNNSDLGSLKALKSSTNVSAESRFCVNEIAGREQGIQYTNRTSILQTRRMSLVQESRARTGKRHAIFT